MIEVQLLGGLRVAVDGVEIPALPARPRRAALLAYLAVARCESREKLCYLFWPDRDPDRARHNLRQTIYELRRELGGDVLENRAGEVRASCRMRVDVGAFEALMEAGRHRQAIDAYGGPFLDGVRLAADPDFEKWIEETRRRLERGLRRAYCALYEGEADAHGRIDIARDWVDRDPLDDEAQHALIASLGALGRRREALRQYDRYTALLRDELDIRPLGPTVELARAMRSSDGAPPPSPGSGRASDLETGSSPGREPPLEGGSGGLTRPWPIPPDSTFRSQHGRAWGGRSVAFAIAVLFAGLVAVSSMLPTSRTAEAASRTDARQRIVALPFENLTGDTAANLIGAQIGAMVTAGLVDGGIGSPYSFGELYELGVVKYRDSSTGPGQLAVRVAESVGAGTVLSGRILPHADGPVVMGDLLDLSDGNPRLVENIKPVPIDLAAPGPALVMAVDRMMALAGAYLLDPAIAADRATPQNLTVPPSTDAFRAYLRGLALANESDWKGAAASFVAAYEIDTTNVAYGIEAAGRLASAAQDRGYTTNGPQWRQADSLIKALEPRAGELRPVTQANFELVRAWVATEVSWDDMWDAGRRLYDLAPGTLEHYKGAWASAQAHRMGAAAAMFEALDRERGSLANWAPSWVWLYTAYWFLADYDRAAQVAGEAADRLRARAGVSRYFLALQAAALTRLGEDSEILAVLDEVDRLEVGPCSRASVYVRVLRESIRLGHDLTSGAPGVAVERFREGFEDQETCRAYGMALVHLENWGGAVRFWSSLRQHRLREDRTPLLDEYAYLAIALAGSGDRAGAARELAHLRRVGGADRRGEGHFLSGTVLYQLGDTVGAMEAVRVANRRGYPKAEMGLHPLSMRLWELGEFQELMRPVE